VTTTNGATSLTAWSNAPWTRPPHRL